MGSLTANAIKKNSIEKMAAGPKFSLVKLKKFSIYVEEKYV
jgi:hypothetical protein